MIRAGVALALVAAAVVLAAPLGAAPAVAGCPTPQATRADAARVAQALGAGRDVWGERLLALPNGPSYQAARHFLPPLLYAVGRGGSRLTGSGVYYLPFTLPYSVGGPRGFGLHVADGSEIVVRRAGGPSLTVGVGPGGRERYGSCLARLATPRLEDGYLPILETSYAAADGTRYEQESFVGRLPRVRSLVSFVHLTGSGGGAATVVRAPHSTLRAGGASFDLYAAFVHDDAHLERIDAGAYTAARSGIVAYWQAGLAVAPVVSVPEQAVQDAERALLVQQLELTWRYSVGNAYEELSFAEALDVAEVTAAYGYGDVSRQILRYTLRQLPRRFTYWRAGERLLAGATYFALDRDRDYVDEETPALRRVVATLAREIATSPTGTLPRERYSSDIADHVYSLHGQTLVWQGLLAMARVWDETARPALAARCRHAARRLEAGLRRAVAASARRLPDGSLFVPVALLDREQPYRKLTSSRAGTYWNLVAPYALASGFFRPHGDAARGLVRYLLGHGSRLLGLVRAGAYRLSGDEPGAPSGTDQVYGINVARFLADNDEPDQLDLSLYGTLAAALTPGTYISGEAASVAPSGGDRYRQMYLPPNNDSGAGLLETLRLLLVHEVRTSHGAPRGLELAFATPRRWLAPGKRIAVEGLPTSFGPISYALERRGDRVYATVTPPTSPAPATLRLRLRLPAGERVTGVEVGDEPLRFDARSATVDLSGRTGTFELVAHVTESAR